MHGAALSTALLVQALGSCPCLLPLLGSMTGGNGSRGFLGVIAKRASGQIYNRRTNILHALDKVWFW